MKCASSEKKMLLKLGNLSSISLINLQPLIIITGLQCLYNLSFVKVWMWILVFWAHLDSRPLSSGQARLLSNSHAPCFSVLSMFWVSRIKVELILNSSFRTSTSSSASFGLLKLQLRSVYCNENKISVYRRSQILCFDCTREPKVHVVLRWTNP